MTARPAATTASSTSSACPSSTCPTSPRPPTPANASPASSSPPSARSTKTAPPASASASSTISCSAAPPTSPSAPRTTPPSATAQNVTFRYKGPGSDFGTLHYDGLLDSRTGTANQGGEEFTLSGRHDFTSKHPRGRQHRLPVQLHLSRGLHRHLQPGRHLRHCFHRLHLSRVHNGFELTGLADRYQGIKTIAQSPTRDATRSASRSRRCAFFMRPPSRFNTTDHAGPRLPPTRFSNGLAEVELESAAAGLKRSQPTFVTGGIIERFDFHPQALLPHLPGQSGQRLAPHAAGRRARDPLHPLARGQNQPGKPPMESLAGLARSDFEFAFSVRPPVLERTFVPPPRLEKFFGVQLRHTHRARVDLPAHHRHRRQRSSPRSCASTPPTSFPTPTRPSTASPSACSAACATPAPA